MKGVNIFLADGFEDTEALSTADVLVRGGVKVNLVSVSDEPFVTSSHGLTVGVGHFLSETGNGGASSPKDVMIFPGGMPGTKNLAACRRLVGLMKEHYAAGGTLAAICAAPGLVLGQMDSLEGIEFTCFDGFDTLPSSKGGIYVKRPSVRSGRIITGRSAGYTLDFALEILEFLKGKETADKVREGLFLS